MGSARAFLDQSFDDVTHVIDTNITGTLYLLHRVVKDMRVRGAGRVLITGSIAGFMPGTFQAVYNGTKAFIDSFSWALRNELKDTGVTVTCLMPGVTDTEFFERADLMDTKVGTQENKADPADVAQDRIQGDDGWRRRRRGGPQEQAAVRDGHRHAVRGARRAASQDGRAGLGAQQVIGSDCMS